MSEVDFEADEPMDSFSSDPSFGDSDFSDPGATGGFGDPSTTDPGFGDAGFDQAAAGMQPVQQIPGVRTKPPLNVYTVMLFISLISLIIGIIALAMQLSKYGAI